MYSIEKEFTFEYAHRLYNLRDTLSPCRSIHGHGSEVHIELFSETLNEDDMIIDFTELKIIKEWIDKYLDHAMLLNSEDPLHSYLVNSELCDGQKYFLFHKSDPTAERIAGLIHDIVKLKLVEDLKLPICKIIVTVNETKKNKATYSSEILVLN
jgi:6-pyruvoyltetrahydropterin/6-carboxytetrahydropterin synthase